MDIEPLTAKWEAFGWSVTECSGHNHSELINAFKDAEKTKGRPSVIIAKTIMGKGVKSIENDNRWHGKPPGLNEVEDFIKEIDI
jgi:transketolase